MAHKRADSKQHLRNQRSGSGGGLWQHCLRGPPWTQAFTAKLPAEVGQGKLGRTQVFEKRPKNVSVCDHPLALCVTLGTDLSITIWHTIILRLK